MLSELEKPGPVVKVFTAGDHFHGYEKPADATEMLEILLKRSGYTKPFEWECRIDKLKHCSPETRPIRVIGYKPYGVSIRVKPSFDSTIDYLATLFVPQGSGYSAADLYKQLHNNEKSVSRVIRQTEREEKKVTPVPVMPIPVMMAPVVPVPKVEKVEVPVQTAPEVRPDFINLQAIIKDHNKLGYVLCKVASVEKMNFFRTKVQFVEAVRHECKWDKENHTLSASTRALSELTKHEYLMEVLNERDKIIGYCLSEKGKEFLGKFKPAEVVYTKPAVLKQEPVFNLADMLVNLRDKLRELADVANKIAANNEQKNQLQSQIDVIDRDNEELSKVIHKNKDSYEVLTRLGQVVVPLPMHHSTKNGELSLQTEKV